MLRLYLLCLVFFVDGLGGWMGETSDRFMDNGARYGRLIYELIGDVEEVKSPCGCRGFDEYAPHINPSGRSSAEDMSRSLYIPGWE